MAMAFGTSTSLDRRLMIFFDWSNFYHGSKSAGYKIEPHKLRDFFTQNLRVKMAYKGDPELVRTYVYFTELSESHTGYEYQKGVIDFLESENTQRVEVRLGRLGKKIEEDVICPGCKREFKATSLGQKGVDVSIAADMVDLAYKNAFDSAILVSGDSDFVPAIQYVKSLGKIVGVASFRNRISKEQEIMKIADVRIFIDEFLAEKDLFQRKT